MKTKTNNLTAKDKLLEAAQGLMLAKGYTATTVDEICMEAGLTKGSFFHYFESKEDLSKAALDRFASSMFQMMEEAPFHKREDPLKRVFGFLDFMLEIAKNPAIPKSCLIGNFSQELSGTHPEIRSLCEGYFSQWSEALKKDLDDAKRRYKPKASFDSLSLADHFIAVMEGSLILAKAKQETNVIEESIGHLRKYIKGLFQE